jgi:hypothetical protein
MPGGAGRGSFTSLQEHGALLPSLPRPYPVPSLVLSLPCRIISPCSRRQGATYLGCVAFHSLAESCSAASGALRANPTAKRCSFTPLQNHAALLPGPRLTRACQRQAFFHCLAESCSAAPIYQRAAHTRRVIFMPFHSLAASCGPAPPHLGLALHPGMPPFTSLQKHAVLLPLTGGAWLGGQAGPFTPLQHHAALLPGVGIFHRDTIGTFHSLAASCGPAPTPAPTGDNVPLYFHSLAESSSSAPPSLIIPSKSQSCDACCERWPLRGACGGLLLSSCVAVEPLSWD